MGQHSVDWRPTGTTGDEAVVRLCGKHSSECCEYADSDRAATGNGGGEGRPKSEREEVGDEDCAYRLRVGWSYRTVWVRILRHDAPLLVPFRVGCAVSGGISSDTTLTQVGNLPAEPCQGIPGHVLPNPGGGLPLSSCPFLPGVGYCHSSSQARASLAICFHVDGVSSGEPVFSSMMVE